MKSKGFDKQKIWQCVFLALCYIVLMVFIALCKNQIDSDFAGEMIFSKLISQEKGIFTEKWYYSTEINLLHTPLVMAPFFWIFESWQNVRIATGAFLFLLLLGSYFYFCAQAGHKKYHIAFGSVLVLPFCWSYLKYILFGYYYANYIIISFFCLGMIFRLNNKDNKKLRWFVWAMYLVLSFLAGLGTIRQLFVLFYPLCLGGLIMLILDVKDVIKLGNVPITKSVELFIKNIKGNKYFEYFFTECAGAFVASVGYVLNVLVLRDKYSFNSYDRTEFIQLDFDRLGEVFTGHLYIFGYEQNREVLSAYGIANMMSIALAIAIFVILWKMAANYKKYKLTSQVSIMYLACAMLFNLFIYVFCNIYSERYILPYSIFFIVIMCIYVEEYNTTEYIKRWFAVIAMVILVFNSAMQYVEWIGREEANDKSDLVSFMAEKDYGFGMASFWNCNIVTEITDGKVIMRNVYTRKWDTLENEHWLEVKGVESMVSENPMFILLDTKEYEDNMELPHFSDEYKVFENDRYVVFEYASSVELAKISGHEYWKVEQVIE